LCYLRKQAGERQQTQRKEKYFFHRNGIGSQYSSGFTGFGTVGQKTFIPLKFIILVFYAMVLETNLRMKKRNKVCA
jgi:hypothetical protein